MGVSWIFRDHRHLCYYLSNLDFFLHLLLLSAPLFFHVWMYKVSNCHYNVDIIHLLYVSKNLFAFLFCSQLGKVRSALLVLAGLSVGGITNLAEKSCNLLIHSTLKRKLTHLVFFDNPILLLNLLIHKHYPTHGRDYHNLPRVKL